MQSLGHSGILFTKTKLIRFGRCPILLSFSTRNKIPHTEREIFERKRGTNKLKQDTNKKINTRTLLNLLSLDSFHFQKRRFFSFIPSHFVQFLFQKINWKKKAFFSLLQGLVQASTIGVGGRRRRFKDT